LKNFQQGLKTYHVRSTKKNSGGLNSVNFFNNIVGNYLLNQGISLLQKRIVSFYF
jgi:hypothetical protein